LALRRNEISDPALEANKLGSMRLLTPIFSIFFAFRRINSVPTLIKQCVDVETLIADAAAFCRAHARSDCRPAIRQTHPGYRHR